MSAKKRGPGRPPKNKSKAKVRKPAPTAVHTVPSHFWGQVGAILLALVTVMLTLGLFGIGGTLPLELATAVRWLLGWTAFVIPIVFAIQIIQVFKQPEDRIPVVIWVATILFLSIFAGLFQLFIVDPKSLILAQEGNGGGTVGWAVADFTLSFVNVPLAAVIFVALLMVLVMFIFSISPKALVDGVSGFFKTEEASVDDSESSQGSKIKLGGLRKGEIDSPSPDAVDDKEKKPGRLARLAARHKDNNDDSTDDEPKIDDKPMEVKKPDSNKPVAGELVDAPVEINNSNWKLPSIKLLSSRQKQADPGDVKLRAQQVESTLEQFNISGKVRRVNVGPRVTQYCLELQRGVLPSRVANLADKFSLDLAVENVRIEAPIPGQPYVGVEIPNKSPASVSLLSILKTKEWINNRSPLAFAVGLNITGEPIVLDLAELPHLLIAGTTGSGKSVMENIMILSLLFRNTPDDMKFVMVDPKGNEMAQYADLPHLAAPIISGTLPDEMNKLVKTLLWLTQEMDRRYDVFRERGGIKNLADFKKKFPDEKMPRIVLIIDEYTDLIDSLKSEREVAQTAIQRIAQKGRAAGIHEVIAMQAPRAKYIQGPLRANIPAGFAFMVTQKMESQQIIRQSGAEKLMGKGDMLMITAKLKKPRRVQSAFVDDSEVQRVVTELKLQSGPQYDETLMAQLSDNTPVNGGTAIGNGGNSPDYMRAVQAVINEGKASTSLLQRRLGIGYGKAARIMDEMQENGVIGPQNGSKPREVLISSIDEAQ